MAGYLGSVPVPQATQHRETFTCTEGQTSFATAGYTPQFLDVYLNGSHLSPADFTASNGSDVILSVAASADDVCDIISYTPFEVNSQTFTGTTTLDGAVVINQSSADVDFRVESNGNANMLFVDGGLNKVGIGVVPVQGNLTIKSGGNTYATSALVLEDADSTTRSYITHVNNTLAITNDTTVDMLLIDATGAVTMPAQPAFLARPASNQANLPINATTTIAFGTEIFDQNADFASNTFTAPVAGRYLLTTGLYSRALDHDTSYYQLELATSNRVYYDIISMSGFDADVAYYEFKISVLADMDASDTAYVRMGIPNNGAAQVQIDPVSNFSGHLVA